MSDDTSRTATNSSARYRRYRRRDGDEADSALTTSTSATATPLASGPPSGAASSASAPDAPPAEERPPSDPWRGEARTDAADGGDAAATERAADGRLLRCSRSARPDRFVGDDDDASDLGRAILAFVPGQFIQMLAPLGLSLAWLPGIIVPL